MSASNLSLEMADGNRDSQAFIVSSAIIPRPFWVGSINVEIEFVGAVDKTPYLKVSGNWFYAILRSLLLTGTVAHDSSAKLTNRSFQSNPKYLIHHCRSFHILRLLASQSQRNSRICQLNWAHQLFFLISNSCSAELAGHEPANARLTWIFESWQWHSKFCDRNIDSPISPRGKYFQAIREFCILEMPIFLVRGLLTAGTRLRSRKTMKERPQMKDSALRVSVLGT